ncbi:PEP/pyruvate-binding domain-containing protein [Pseudodesulfovibrio portus]|uniref:Phosphoenolpyruvate synthase n=1 Tax=Pseudodesulfovibrio portus TaxID=231439 RepID=A0ABM8AUP0_9BACT|nr:PEP/pyruvate-binding domain-containing protein [Pseudodesulfovibrio portus]BDQ34962.1 phosphoenolpyruvate synthase [Pseudodesulfovibrio portus]
MGWFDWLPWKKRERTPEEIAEIRRTFAVRYDHFRLLIQANTRAHELIGELEEALRGFTPYGMQYVQTLCTRISTSIYKMVRHLGELNPKGQAELNRAMESINEKIMAVLIPEEHPESGQPVIDLARVGRDHADLCGPKMAMLGEAGSKLGLTIPAGFVITVAAYRRFMQAGGIGGEIDRLITATDENDRAAVFKTSADIMQLIMDTPVPSDLAEAILGAYDALSVELERQPELAVRSSALGEDAEGSSFAGQYRSVLNVDRGSLIDAYREVVASKYSRQAMAYRMNHGIPDTDVAMSVGCMTMVGAAAGGVAYSRSPVNVRDDHVSIHSVWGLPKPVVDGTAETDEFHVSRNPLAVSWSVVADKTVMFVCGDDEGVCREDLAEDRMKAPSLTEEQALAVAREAIRIEEHFGTPQDIEWAMDMDGGFHLLQCRPLMQVSADDAPGAGKAERGDSALPEPVLSGGRVASPGVGVGPAYTLRKDVDALTFPDGGVMIIKQALPSRAALLDRCSAVVAEQGGMAGHLANVAREFGVPALFGLKGAVGHFENGTILTVDADGRSVYRGAVESLLVERPRQRVMQGSQVHAALRQAARHIVRLNLTNPESPEFRPEKCRTLHDVMRYCHEKAVSEMFEFGTNEDFIEAASRQLICGVPKQFWILNLDDGFAPETRERTDRCVLLEQVESYPMQALWAGMQAVPWEGPPPVHARGLMSVMFEATTNPNLVTAAGSHYTQKNYFMVSKNYCALQSRFGFHYCGVESLVSDRISENYASFQFKGGAANAERRILRARFVGDLLEEFDFRVRVREDNLVARVEGLARESMGKRLKILGYLITHTRQLDMIMTDKAAVKRRRERFLKDFEMFN